MRSLLMSLLILLNVATAAEASTTSSIGLPGGEGNGPFASLGPSTGVSLSSGTMTHEVPIVIPPGRKDATPALALVYSSDSHDGPFGQGWDLPLGHIERSTKNGVPRCKGDPGFDFTNDFVLSLQGSVQELVQVGSVYRPKRDTSFLEATKDEVNNTWQVQDRSGRTYSFGTVPTARLWTGGDVFRDEATCRFTSVWGLTQIKDSNGNTIDIDYLSGIPALVPQYISYGGTAGAHPFRVEFTYIDHPNPTAMFRRGVRERQEKLVNQIIVESRNNTSSAFSEVRTYTLTYDADDLQSDCGDPSAALLCQISTPLLPTQNFSYSNSDLVLGASTPVSSPDGADKLRKSDGTSVNRSIMDFNADGLTDLVKSDGNNTWHFYPGTRGGILSTPTPPTWAGPGHSNLEAQTDGSGGTTVKVKRETIDLSGDGIPDYIDSDQLSGGGTWQVYLGQRTYSAGVWSWGFSSTATLWTAPEAKVGESTLGSFLVPGSIVKEALDINGDGRPDLIKQVYDSQAQVNRWQIYLNTGSGFTAQPISDFDATNVLLLKGISGFSPGTAMIFDFNGDGLPDSVSSPNDSGIEVRLNNGHGFEAPILSPTAEIPPEKTYVTDCYGSSCRRDFIDVNGDGRPDKVRVGSDDRWNVQLNRGEKLATTSQGAAAESVYSTDTIGPIRENDTYLGHTGTDVFDWNGDGILDRVDASDSHTWYARLGGPRNGGPTRRPFLLTAVDNGLGGKTYVRYAPSTDFVNGPLPMVRWVVTGVRRTDGLCDASGSSDAFSPQSNPCINSGHEVLATYGYVGGLFDGPSREFRGFQKVTESDAAGNHLDVTFDQTDAMGRELSREVFAGPSTVRRESLVWATQPDGPNGERTQFWIAQHKFEELSVPDDADLRLCRMDLAEAPDPYGRVSTVCSYDCHALPTAPTSCANVAIGAVRSSTAWANPDGISSVRNRTSSVLKAYQTASGSGGWTPLTEEHVLYDNKTEGHVGVGNATKVTTKLERSYAQVVPPGSPPDPDPPDPEVSATYGAYGNLLTVTDARGTTTTLDYGAPDNPFQLYAHTASLPDTTLPDNSSVHHVTSQLVDIRYGKTTSATDENNAVTASTYDALGRMTCLALPNVPPNNTCDSSDASSRYDYQYRVASADPNISYEAKLSYIEVQERSGDSSFLTRRTYFDALGRKRFSTVQRIVEGGSSLDTVIEGQTDYDANGRVSATYSPYVGPALATPPSVAGATQVDYNLNGQAGLSDPLGRPHRILPPDGDARTALFKGIQTQAIDPVGSTTVSTRDAFGREVKREVYSSGPTGDPVTKTDLTLDGLGRVLASTTTDPQQTPPKSFMVTSTFDMLGREIERNDPDSGLWKFGYDGGGNLVYYKSPKLNQHVELCYDVLGRPAARYGYTSDGYVGCSTPTVAAESLYAYDQGSNGIGRLHSVSDSSGSPGDGEVFSYDVRGRVVRSDKTVLGKTASTQFAYDAAGRLWRVTYPDLEVVSTSYRADGQIGGVSGDLFYLSSATYDVMGRPRTIGHGNGTQDALQYYDKTQNFRLSRITSNSSASTLFDLEYSYEARGKVAAIADHRNASGDLSNGASYQYDPVGRLTTVDWVSGVDETFTHDGLGNITSKSGQLITYSATKPHQATALGSLISSMSYDKAGGRTTRVTSGETQVYTYDSFDRVQYVSLCPTPSPPCPDNAAYTYDFTDRRVSKTVTDSSGTAPPLRFFNQYVESQNGQITKYYYAGERMIASRDRAWTALSEAPVGSAATSEPLRLPALPPMVVSGFALLILVLLAGPGQRPIRIRVALAPTRALGIAVIFLVGTCPTRAVACGGNPPPPVRHYHLDHLGSVEVISDQNAAVQRQIRYRAYGEVRGYYDGSNSQVLPTETTRQTFTGYESEVQVEAGKGLQYARARYYDPELGQFLSHDPMGQYLSPYAYGPGDPLNGEDPTGQDWMTLVPPADGTPAQDASGPSYGPTWTELGTWVPSQNDSVLDALSPTSMGGSGPLTREQEEWIRDQEEASFEAYYKYMTEDVPARAEARRAEINRTNEALESSIKQQISALSATSLAISQTDSPVPIGPYVVAGGVLLVGTAGILLNALVENSRSIPRVLSEPRSRSAGPYLVRFGPGPESAETLGRAAAAAAAIGFPHGVSARLVSRVSASVLASGRVAPLAEVRAQFPVIKTGQDPRHFTVVLPDPVTEEDASRFNAIFTPK